MSHPTTTGPLSVSSDATPVVLLPCGADVGRSEKSSRTAANPITINEVRGTRTHDAPLMLQKDYPNVLPLHLTPIDSYFLADDKPQYPMTSIIRLEFSGQIEPRAFDAALTLAMQRHPLTRAVIRPAKRGMPCWVHDASIAPVVHWGDIDQPVMYAERESIDLSLESGLRFWIRSNEQQTIMTLQVHHACTDGTGIYRFLGDLLAVYGTQVAGGSSRQPDLADVDLRLLRQRRTRFAKLAVSATSLQFIRHGIGQTLSIFGRRVKPLANPIGTQRSRSMLTQFPGVFSVRFDKDEHKLLRGVAAEHGGMLNDLLLAEMFRTIIRWNERQGEAARGNLRIMMPSDLREQQDYPMPATNMTAYTFITRATHECADFGHLMRGVREETSKIKHQQLGKQFMDTIHFANFAPRVMKFLLGMNRCISTTILSNVGDPSKRFTASFPRDKGRIVAGNLTLEDITGVPPLRTGSRATLAVFSYLRNLTISVRCDPYHFTPDDSLAFAQMYAEGLRSHISGTVNSTAAAC